MLKVVYDFALLLFTILCLPKFLWDAIRHRKYRKSFLEKLGIRIPSFSLPHDGVRIWVHAVSVGEAKAVASLVEKLQNHASIVFSSTTETGLAEAQRSMPELNSYFYLPLDFSWTMKRIMDRIQPHLLILVETDFWYNLLDLNKNVVLVNGKMSETSLKRFRNVPFFSRRLFEKIRLFCVQNEHYANRFKDLQIDPNKIVVTGNLKFDQASVQIDKDLWNKNLGIQSGDRVLTIGSTHHPEEEQILTNLEPLFEKYPTLKILLVPRHPDRFNAIAELLVKRKISFARFSDHTPKTGAEKVILVDAMGILCACYTLSELAIVGGSFVSHVGGHNIFEPAMLGVPVLFGPHMETQKDLVDTILEAKAGKQVTLSTLSSTIDELLQNPSTEMRTAGLRLSSQVHGSTDRTWKELQKILTTLH